MEKIIIYTSITADKDFPREDIKVFSNYAEFKRPVMNAKIYKVLAHQFIDADISIWVDGNVFPQVSPEELVKEYLGDADMFVFTHSERDCVYEEAEAAKGLGLEAIPYIEKHIKFYKRIRYPKHNGLYECGFIIRRHNKKIEAFNNAWWAEICRYSNRDQLSFPYVLEKCPVKLATCEGNVRDNKLFKYTPHPMQYVGSEPENVVPTNRVS